MRPVFVVGCDRSGTTITKRIMNKSLGLEPLSFEPRLLIDGDLAKGVFTSLWRPFDSNNAIMTKKWIMRQFDIDERRGWKNYFDKNEFVERIDSVLEELQLPGNSSKIVNSFTKSLHNSRFSNKGQSSQFFVDDTPANVLVIKEIVDVFPDAKIIHCIRNPKDVVNSIKEKGWWSKDEKVILNKWLSIVRNGRAMGAFCSSDNYKEIVFDQALADPVSIYQDVIEWIEPSASLDIDNFDVSRKRYVDKSWSLESYYRVVAHDLIDEFGW